MPSVLAHRFPTALQDLGQRMIGRTIVSVRRYLLRSDFDELPERSRHQESDGPVELTLDDGTRIHFVPDAEQMSVKVAEGRMPAWGEHYILVEPTANDFWSPIVGRPISEVTALVSVYATPDNRSEFGVELKIEGSRSVLIEYLSDEEHPDLLRVTSGSPSLKHRRVSLARRC